MKLRCFKLYLDYSISLSSLNVGNLSGIEFQRMYRSSGKVLDKTFHFHVVVVLFFCQSKSIAFFAVLIDVAVIVA